MGNALLAIAFLIVAKTPAAADRGACGPLPHPAAAVERHASELGLTAATLEELGAISSEQRAGEEALRLRIHEARLALREALEVPTPDEAAVLAIAAELGALEAEMTVSRVTSILDVRGLLTTGQNQALIELIDGFHAENREAVDAALAACQLEVEQHCPDAEGPPFRALRCLEHTADVELSEACGAALDSLPNRGRRGRAGRELGRRFGF